MKGRAKRGAKSGASAQVMALAAAEAEALRQVALAGKKKRARVSTRVDLRTRATGHAPAKAIARTPGEPKKVATPAKGGAKVAAPAKHVRLKDDAYYSPPALAKAIVRRLLGALQDEGVDVQCVLEPSSGGDAFVNAVRGTWPGAHIIAVEPNRPARHGWHFHQYSSTFEAWCEEREKSKAAKLAMPRDIDLVIGNPPYALAEEHVALARKTAPWVAFLLRLSFLGSQERAKTVWAAPGLSLLIPISRRPSFTGTGSDASEYAVFVWQQGYTGDARLLPHLQWSEDE